MNSLITSPKGPALRPFMKNLAPSATLLINERSKTLIAEGKKVYRLGFGQSPFPVPDEVVQSLQQFAHEKDYLPVKGLPALREAVANYNRSTLGLDCNADDIMIGPGSKELILGLQLVCEAELLLPSPSWVSYEPQAHIAQSKVSWIETTEKDKWLLTAETLEEVLSKRSGSPQILLLNYPSNPIGATFSEDQLRDLARVARKYNLTIVADEIYGELTFSGNYSSIAQFYPEGTIISSGLSKWCGAGGWRLGTFTFPKAYRYILDTMATLASESFSAVSAPVQYAAITAFNGSTAIQAYIKNSRKILDVIGHFVHKSLLVNKVSLPAPEGGFYLFPNFEYYRGPLERKGIRTNTDFCESLLEETGIALLPGKAFGRPSTELTCRLSYVDFDGEKALNAAKELGGEKLDEVFIKTICPNMYKSMQVLGNWLKQM